MKPPAVLERDHREAHKRDVAQALSAPWTASQLAADPGSSGAAGEALFDGGETARAVELAAPGAYLLRRPEIERIAARLEGSDAGLRAPHDLAELAQRGLRRRLVAVDPGSMCSTSARDRALLALMAARAGAAGVVSCELNGAMAAAGPGCRAWPCRPCRIVAGAFERPRIGTSLAGPANVIVSETVANNLLE